MKDVLNFGCGIVTLGVIVLGVVGFFVVAGYGFGIGMKMAGF